MLIKQSGAPWSTQPRVAFKSKSAGFTLIEILVVVVLIGLLASVAVVTISSNSLNRDLEEQSRKLHAFLMLSLEEAVLRNTEIGLTIDSEGYEFLQYEDRKQRWLTAGVEFLRPVKFPEWLAIELEREVGEKVSLGDSEDEVNDEEDLKIPDIMLFSSEEATPFKISLQIENDSDVQYRIWSNGFNGIKLALPGEEIDELEN